MMCRTSKTRWTAWGATNERLNDHFVEVFGRKSQLIDYVVKRCIGAGEYDRLETNAKRWQLAYRRGWRIVRVTVKSAGSTP